MGMPARCSLFKMQRARPPARASRSRSRPRSDAPISVASSSSRSSSSSSNVLGPVGSAPAPARPRSPSLLERIQRVEEATRAVEHLQEEIDLLHTFVRRIAHSYRARVQELQDAGASLRAAVGSRPASARESG